jgi:hypothetical protein
MTVAETASSDLLVSSTVTPPAGALVLGADYRALGVVRSLGRRGVNVWVLREPEEPLAASSRYAKRALRWPEGGEEERLRFLENLADAAGHWRWALVPTSDEAAAFTARHFDRLGARFTHTTPDWEVRALGVRQEADLCARRPVRRRLPAHRDPGLRIPRSNTAWSTCPSQQCSSPR